MINTTDKVKEKLNTIPNSPGIYKFLDHYGNIIYIGKSKTLSKRVKSYFVDNPKWDKVNKMTPYIDDLDYIVTDTHLEARLLECKLIKSVKPMFNSQMKNHERYCYIKIQEYNRYNPISIEFERTANCFGPFRRKHSLYQVVDLLRNLYPISKSNDKYEFEFNILPISMDKSIYERNKEILLEIFSEHGNLDKFINAVEEKMNYAASLYKFETASIYRDIIFSLNYMKTGINGYKDMSLKNIILKIPVENGVKLFFIKNGQLVHKKTYKRLSEKSYELFVNHSLILSKSVTSNDEKVSLDYRDILYSEILSLPDHMIYFY
ncbi:MAG: GIY-YIG nuclease family protein [Tissierellaceae bacterium]|nr:GIY-YIG nuclease family protein [Tissierellaceae bacterium]